MNMLFNILIKINKNSLIYSSKLMIFRNFIYYPEKKKIIQLKFENQF